MARPDWINRAGGLDTDENAKLDTFLSRYELDIWRKAETDPVFNKARHRLTGCKWWKAGQGMVVDGEWIESPAVVLSKHEER